MHRALPVLVLIAIAVAITGPAVLTAAPSSTALVVWDPPFSLGNAEYSLFKSVLGGVGVSMVAKSAWEVWLLRSGGWFDWLRGAGYVLVVILWSREGYRSAFPGFVGDAIRAGVPILFLLGEGWNVTEPLGLVMVRAPGPLDLAVVDDPVTRGVYRAGPCGGVGVTYLFFRVNSSATNVSWRPLVVDRVCGGAAAAIGVVNGTRIAVVAPYLYAANCLDNPVLLRNIVLWLLGRENEIGEGEEVVAWGAPSFKNLSLVRQGLLKELEELNSSIAKLNRTRQSLEEEVKSLEERAGELRSLVGNLSKRVDELRREVEELESRREALLRKPSPDLFTGILIGVVVGAAVTLIATPVIRRAGRG